MTVTCGIKEAPRNVTCKLERHVMNTVSTRENPLRTRSRVCHRKSTYTMTKVGHINLQAAPKARNEIASKLHARSLQRIGAARNRGG